MLYPFSLLSILLLCCFSANAADFCVEQWACSETRQTEQGVQIWLINQKAFPVTMTLKAKSRGYRSRNGDRSAYTRTRVLQGYEETLALTLIPSGSGRTPWYHYEFSWAPGDMFATHNDNHLYLKPYPENNNVRLVQGFGGRFSHTGPSRYALDFAMKPGSAVLAAREGVVMDVTEHNTRGGPDRSYADYANFISILHADGTMGEYYHLQYQGAAVKTGEQVKAGQLIGYSGNTGFSSLPHLHFAVYKARSHGRYQSLPLRFAPNTNTTSTGAE